MKIIGATRKQLLSLPKREWNDDSPVYDSILLLSERRVHDSGWLIMTVIGCRKQKAIEIAANCPDDINWDINCDMKTDCAKPSAAIHFWTRDGKGLFRVGVDISSVDILVGNHGRS